MVSNGCGADSAFSLYLFRPAPYALVRETTMKKLAIGLALAVLVSGCAAEPTVFRLVGFNEAETAEVQSAMAEWCYASGDDYCPAIGDSGNTIALYDDMAHAGECRVSAKMALGEPVGTILIQDRRDLPDWPARMRRTVLHELGHAAGCVTHMAAGNVMAENEDDEPWHVTYADARCVIGN
jgi:hypothetical protein